MKRLLCTSLQKSLVRRASPVLGAVLLAVGTALAGSPLNTKGIAGVDAIGRANYQIPIAVPPGTAGMAPTISLSYVNGPNGIMGVGWTFGAGFTSGAKGKPGSDLANLEGSSEPLAEAVTRCPANLTMDGAVGGVRLDASDKFCLNGQRLVVQGSGTYGADSTEYRTEVETFTKVVSYGAAGTGPAWFKVWTQSGIILEYGNTSDSRIEAPGSATARVWAANKVSDRNGNYYGLSYLDNPTTGEYILNRIDYSGNAATGLLPYNSVRFGYDNVRSDVALYSVDSALIQRNSRLISVKTYTGESMVMDYRLAYSLSNPTQRSLLVSLTECAADGACKGAVNIGYTPGGGGIPSGAPAADLGTSMGANTVVKMLPGDFNGDGVQDVWIVDNVGWTRICYGPTFALAQCTALWFQGAYKAIVLDYNGDGVSDMAFHATTGQLYFCPGPAVVPGPGLTGCLTAANAVYPNAEFLAGDFDGDGIDELFGWTITQDPFEVGIHCHVGLIIAGNYCNGRALNGTNYKVYKGDFDGDGRDDLLFAGTSSYRVCGANAIVTGGAAQCSTAIPSSINLRDGAQVVVGDYTGDGKADLLLLTAGGLHQCRGPGLMTANNCAGVSGGTGWDWLSLYRGYSGDFNGDGTQDLLLVANGNVVYLCPGPAIATYNNCSTVYSSNLFGAMFAAGDFNGDGSSDVLVTSGTSIALYAGATAKPDLLAAVSDGAFFNSTTSFAYSPLTNNAIYTKGTGAAYPLQDTRYPYWVVTQMQVPNGVGAGAGGTNTHSYKYEKARFNAQGRGFLGFEVTRRTDHAAGREIVTTRAQTYPHFFRVTDEQVFVGGQLMRKHFRDIGTISTFEGRLISVVQWETDVSYGLDGVWKSDKIFHSTDPYGNSSGSLHLWNEFSPNQSGSYRRTESRQFQPDTSQWLFPRLQQSDVTLYTESGASVLQRTSFTMPPGSLLPSQAIDQPHDPPFRVVTDYTRDAYGNVLSATVSAPGIATRATSATYDGAGRYPITKTNALGQVTGLGWDARFGLQTSVTDPNTLTTTTTYDPFGRKAIETRPDGGQTSWGYALCDCSYPENESIAYYVYVGTTGAAYPSYLYFDLFDRQVMSTTRNFADNDWIDPTNVWFDALGRTSRSYLPYDRSAAVKPFASSAFDAYGRLASSFDPKSGTTTYGYSAQPYAGPVNTTQTNAKGQVTQHARNIRGELILVVDANGKSTSYEYGPHGRITKTIDALGNQATIGYDALGHVISKNDPDLGAWTFTYDALGQLTTQTDAKAQVTTFSYDKLGRMIQRAEPSQTATWTYDNAVNGIGKIGGTSTNLGVARAYTYDGYGRPSGYSLLVDGAWYAMATSYDSAGRPAVITYPTGFAVKRVYNPMGYLHEIRNNATNALYWKIVNQSALGILEEDYGNGTGVLRTRDPNTRRVSRIWTIRDSDGATIQDFQYGYDVLGNVTSRQEYSDGALDNYTYDELNRLTSVVGSAPKTFGYNEIGNLTFKSDVGTYVYPSSGKVHAAYSAGSVGYGYDANGNATTIGPKTVTWNSFNMPANVQWAASTYSWSYDADLQRAKYTRLGKTVVYVSDGNEIDFERINWSFGLQDRHYIRLGRRIVAVQSNFNGSPAADYYFYLDALGSTTMLVHQGGGVVEKSSFDAHGKRRFPSGADDPGNSLAGSGADRGFTSHEHLDEIGLIHMNGRLYEPGTGRFVSADPFIQLEDPQGFNRYAYVLNSPTRYLDSNGFDIDGDIGGLKTGERRERRDPTSACAANPLGCRAYDPRFELDKEDPSRQGGSRWDCTGPRCRAEIDGYRIRRDERNPWLEIDPSGWVCRNLRAAAGPISRSLRSGWLSRVPFGRDASPDYVTISMPTVISPFVGVPISIDRHGRVYLGIGLGWARPALGAALGYIPSAIATTNPLARGNIIQEHVGGVSLSAGAGVGVDYSPGGEAAHTITTPGFGVSFSQESCI